MEFWLRVLLSLWGLYHKLLKGEIRIMPNLDFHDAATKRTDIPVNQSAIHASTCKYRLENKDSGS
jgi:hypothetical protein